MGTRNDALEHDAQALLVLLRSIGRREAEGPVRRLDVSEDEQCACQRGVWPSSPARDIVTSSFTICCNTSTMLPPESMRAMRSAG